MIEIVPTSADSRGTSTPEKWSKHTIINRMRRIVARSATSRLHLGGNVPRRQVDHIQAVDNTTDTQRLSFRYFDNQVEAGRKVATFGLYVPDRSGRLRRSQTHHKAQGLRLCALTNSAAIVAVRHMPAGEADYRLL
jgi:hypothetical protein